MVTDTSDKLRHPIRTNALNLALFAIITAALLATVYIVSLPHIQDNQLGAQTRTLSAVMPAHMFGTSLLHAPFVMPQPQLLNQTTGTLIYVARQQQAITGFILPITSTEGYSGPIKILVGIDTQGQVTGVRVIEHRETPGLGDKIDYQKSHWVDSFIGTDLLTHHWAVEKDGGNFDQFTGATITPRAIVNAVANSLHYFRQYQAQLIHLAQASLEAAS